ncbi:hypothetical protein VTI74DRAFT_10739 [Chaetomium olivicolor]
MSNAYSRTSLPSNISHVGLGFSISVSTVYLPAAVFFTTYSRATFSTFAQSSTDVPTAVPSASISASACASHVRRRQFGSPCTTGTLDEAFLLLDFCAQDTWQQVHGVLDIENLHFLAFPPRHVVIFDVVPPPGTSWSSSFFWARRGSPSGI